MKLKKIFICLLTFSLIIPTYAFATPSDPTDMYDLEGQVYAGTISTNATSSSSDPKDVSSGTPSEDETQKEKDAQAEETATREQEEQEELKKEGVDTDAFAKKTEELKSDTNKKRDRDDIKTSEMSKNGALTPNILSGLAGNADKVFDISGTVTSLPFDKLYGVSVRSTSYLGEVPGGMKDFKNSEYPSMNDYRIDGQKRTWWAQPQKVSADLKWSKDSTNDIHALNLRNAPTGFDAMGVFFSNTFCMLLMFVNGLFVGIVGFFIAIANFDIKGLMDILQWKSLADLFKRLFIGDGFGSISPVFIIALVAFMISLAGMVIRYLRQGNQAMRELVNELILLILAIILAGVGYSGSYDTLIEKTNSATVRFMQGINNDMGESSELFTQKTSDAFADAAATQMALVNKITIDTIIRSQFGVPVSELTLYDSKKPELTAENWAIDTSEMKRLIGAITWSGASDYLSVYTGKSASNNQNPNLGYFWYAVSSGTYHSDPFIQKDKKIYAVPGDRNGFLYGVDLLAGIDASAGGSAKAEQILSHFKAPHMDVASMFLCMLISLALIGSISTVSIYCLFAKIIFNIGFVFTPVLVILILVKPFRHIAQQALVTWLVSFMKMLVSQVILFAIIVATGIFCGYGNSGMILAIIVLAVLSRFIPRLLVAINGAMSNINIGGAGQLDAVRSLDNKFNQAANAISNAKSSNANRAAREAMRAQEKNARLDALSKFHRNNLESAVSPDEIEEQLNNFNQDNATGISSDDGTTTENQKKGKNPHDLALEYLAKDDFGTVWNNQELMDSLSPDEDLAFRNVVTAMNGQDFKKTQNFVMEQLGLLDHSTRLDTAKGMVDTRVNEAKNRINTVKNMWDNTKIGKKVNKRLDKFGNEISKTSIYQNYQAYKANLQTGVQTGKTKLKNIKNNVDNKISSMVNKNQYTQLAAKGSIRAGKKLAGWGKVVAKGAMSYIGNETGATALYEFARHSLIQQDLSKIQKLTDLSKNKFTKKSMGQFKDYMKYREPSALEKKPPKINQFKTDSGVFTTIDGDKLSSTVTENAKAAVKRSQFVVHTTPKPDPDPEPQKPNGRILNFKPQNKGSRSLDKVQQQPKQVITPKQESSRPVVKQVKSNQNNLGKQETAPKTMKVLKNNVGQTNITQSQPKQIKTQQPKTTNTVKQNTSKPVEVPKVKSTPKVIKSEPKQIKTQQPKVMNTVKHVVSKPIETPKTMSTPKVSQPKSAETPKLKIIPRTAQQTVTPKSTPKTHHSKFQFDTTPHSVKQEPISRHVQETIKPKRSPFKIIDGKKKG